MSLVLVVNCPECNSALWDTPKRQTRSVRESKGRAAARGAITVGFRDRFSILEYVQGAKVPIGTRIELTLSG